MQSRYIGRVLLLLLKRHICLSRVSRSSSRSDVAGKYALRVSSETRHCLHSRESHRFMNREVHVRVYFMSLGDVPSSCSLSLSLSYVYENLVEQGTSFTLGIKEVVSPSRRARGARTLTSFQKTSRRATRHIRILLPLGTVYTES